MFRNVMHSFDFHSFISLRGSFMFDKPSVSVRDARKCIKYTHTQLDSYSLKRKHERLSIEFTCNTIKINHVSECNSFLVN